MPMYADLDNLIANKAKLQALDKDIERTKELSAQMMDDRDYRITSDFEEHRHKEGTHSDMTEILACQDVSSASMELIDDLKELTVQRHRLAMKIENAETALSFLDDLDRRIVWYRDVKGLSWDDVVYKCQQKTKRQICRKTAYKHYMSALHRIRPFFKDADDA